MAQLMKAPVMLVVASFLFWGCATIMHGTYQKIEVASSPTGANVWIDSSEAGVTPLFVELKRSSDHIVTIGMSGYEEAELKITNSASGWVWGNLVLYVVFSPIGVAIDFFSGGFYSFSFDQLYVDLEEKKP